jgi:hypothetical protein
MMFRYRILISTGISVTLNIIVLWDVTLCSLVDRYCGTRPDSKNKGTRRTAIARQQLCEQQQNQSHFLAAYACFKGGTVGSDFLSQDYIRRNFLVTSSVYPGSWQLKEVPTEASGQNVTLTWDGCQPART